MKKTLCLLLLTLTLLLGGCATRQEAVEAPALLEPVGVQADTAVATLGNLYSVSIAEGSIVADSQELCFEIDGEIDLVNIYPGKWVEEGELLLSLDQSAMEKEIRSLREEISYAETNGAYDDEVARIDIALLEIAKEQLQSAPQPDQDAIAAKSLEIEAAALALKQAQELRALSLEDLRARLAVLEAQYGRNAILAPFSGHVMYEGALVKGTRVQAEKPVAYIVHSNEVSLVVNEYLSEASLAQKNLYALVDDKRYSVEYVPMSREEMTSLMFSGKTLTTQFTLSGPQEDLPNARPGMYAVLCMETRPLENVLIIPSGALYTSSSGERYVYVWTENGRQRRTVQTGRSNGIETQITEGLAEGEVVYVQE